MGAEEPQMESDRKGGLDETTTPHKSYEYYPSQTIRSNLSKVLHFVSTLILLILTVRILVFFAVMAAIVPTEEYHD
jgi:hypothetical protein